MLSGKRWLIALAAILALAVLAFAACGDDEEEAPPPEELGRATFLSTQLQPIEEAEKFRSQIAAQCDVGVDFFPEEGGPFNARVLAEHEAGAVTIDVIGGIHGDFPPFSAVDALSDVSSVLAGLGDRQFAADFVELGKLGTGQQLYVPWMSATYLMAINKQALEFLPEGADVNALTYDQLTEWGANIEAATGDRKLGFPAGEGGLMHRFFQGYLYPSYTGGQVTQFRSAEAVQAWEAFRELWDQLNPQSVTYAFMQEPLLTGEVWVAWDHTARLIDALREQPDDFIVVPAPAGPVGRGFMPVLAGLAIPEGAPNQAEAEALIDCLTRPETQITTLEQVGFFPVVDAEFPATLPAGIILEADGVAAQQTSADALPSLLPVGLGELGGEYNKVFIDAFTQIVLNDADIEDTLEAQAAELQRILNESGAPCWPPDPPSDGPCTVE